MTTSSPMRLSFVSHEFPPIGGGASTALDSLTTELGKRGHFVQVVTVGARVGQDEASDHVRTVVRIPSRRVSTMAPSTPELASTFFALRRHGPRLVARFAPDAIIAFFAFPAGRAILPAARKLAVPLIVSLRGSDVPGFRRRSILNKQPAAKLVLAPVWRHADILVANGTFLAELAGEFDARPVLNIANGVNTEKFHPRGISASSGRPLRVLVVGQLIERKRPLLAINAVTEAADRGTKLVLTFAGDGPLAQDLKIATEELSPTASISFLGHVARDALPGIYSQHDVLLHLSAAEGVSNSILEALASGLPLVTTRDGVNDLTDELDGAALLVGPDPVDVADALCCLAADPSARRRMGQMARSVALHRTWEHVAEGWERHLLEWIGHFR